MFPASAAEVRTAVKALFGATCTRVTRQGEVLVRVAACPLGRRNWHFLGHVSDFLVLG